MTMNLEELTFDVTDLCREVGAYILGEAAQFGEDSVQTKSKNSLVSYVDKTAEKMLVDKLAEFLPEAGFITEEGTSEKKGNTYQWIIDPLDGTTNFIHDIPIYSISIALIRNETLVLGVVYEMNFDESYFAWEGSPAFLNGKEIHVAKNADLGNTLMATGFPYHNYDRLQDYMEVLQFFMHNTRGIRRMGSAAVDLAYVAAGRFDGFFEYGLNPWDIAAGAFLVQQAGGQVCDFKGGNTWLFGDEIVATSGAIHPEFMKPLKAKF
jgi:myo-inositol-1(or 4)-monophosphatase